MEAQLRLLYDLHNTTAGIKYTKTRAYFMTGHRGNAYDGREFIDFLFSVASVLEAVGSDFVCTPWMSMADNAHATVIFLHELKMSFELSLPGVKTFPES